MIHELKIIQPYFSEVKKGAKKFELRRNDRDFKIGDTVVLKEYDKKTQTYSGEFIVIGITYVLKNMVGIDEDYCIFSFEILSDTI
jgi:ASC-1-like (ASCH) protein